MARTIAATIGRATIWARRLTQMKRRGRPLGFGALKEPQEGGQAVPVPDLAPLDQRRQLRDRNPLDLVRLARIRWFAGVLGPVGQEDVEPLVDQADGGEVRQEQGPGPRPPAGFLQ